MVASSVRQKHLTYRTESLRRRKCFSLVPRTAASRCSNISRVPSLLDHFVGAREQRRGDGETQYRCRLVIYNKIEPRGSLNWHLTDRGPLKKPINKNPHAPEHPGKIWAIGHQPARPGEKSEKADCRKTSFQGTFRDAHALCKDERRREDNHPMDCLARCTPNGIFDIR